MTSSIKISPRSFRYIYSTCALLSIFLLIAHSAPSFLSFHPVPVFSLLVHFAFSCTFSPQVLRNFLCHTPLTLPVVSGFFNSFSSFLLVCGFVPFTQLYMHPSSFTGIPIPLVVFPTHIPLPCLPYYISDVYPICGSFVECVAQIFELAYSFYYPSFPFQLILFTLPLSLLELHHFRRFNIHFQLFLPHILSLAPHHFFHFSLNLCHCYHVIRKRQAPNFLSTHLTPPACAFFNISPGNYIVNSISFLLIIH
jgi:hypothetical protein